MQNYRKLIMHSMAFPPISLVGYFFMVNSALTENYEHYQKRSFRNRYFLGSHQGPKMLSIPLEKGKNQQLPIDQVRISYTMDWPQQQLRFIQSNYGNSPYYAYYKDDLDDIFHMQFEYLVDFNNAAMKLILQWLQLQIPIEKTDAYVHQYPENILDLRRFTPLIEKTQMNNPVYRQHFDTVFQDHLCILDLIFHLGPETRLYFTTAANLYPYT